MELYERVKIAREKVGISQRELGRRIGMSGQMISKIEQNGTSPSYETILKIATALNIPASELMPSQNDEITTILKSLSGVFNNLDNLQCIKPLNKPQLIEAFKCIAISIPGLNSVTFDDDECIYNMLHSEEFSIFINLLTSKYVNKKKETY